MTTSTQRPTREGFTLADAGRELQKVPSGGLAQLMLWSARTNPPGQVFAPVKKD